MKIKYSLLIIINLLLAINAYSQNWHWAKGNGGDSIDGPKLQMLCLDNDENIYHSGTISSNPSFFQTDTLSPIGLHDFYITKYNGSGDEIWVKQFGGTNTSISEQEVVNSICFSPFDNSILFSARYYGSIILGNDTLFGFPGVFFASMDTSGSFNWVKTGIPLLGTQGDNYFFAQHKIPTSSWIDSLPVSAGVWLAKYNLDGSLVNAKKIIEYNGSTFEASLANFKVADGRIFGIGSSYVNVFSVDTISVQSDFASDQYFIACFDTNFSALWARSCSGVNSHLISDIELDNDNNIYISGPFYNTAIFDQDTLYTSLQDYFIAKYDSIGNYKWSRSCESSHNQSSDLAIDGENTIYLAAATSDTVFVCNDTVAAPGGGYGKAYIVRYDSSGECISLLQFVDIGVYSIICDDNNKLILTGTFSNIISLGGTTLTSNGPSNILIAKSDALTSSGGEEERRNDQLIIYANPNEGKCKITIPDEFSNEKNLTLSIYNRKGEIIQHGNIQLKDDVIRVNIEAQAKGVYNVLLSNGTKSYAGKIVFE